MNTKRTSRLILFCLAGVFLIYAAGYFWFQRTHTFITYSSAGSFTVISTSTADSILLVLFYPAICLDARFGSDRIFFRADTSGKYLDHYKFFPFMELTPQSERSQPPASTPHP